MTIITSDSRDLKGSDLAFKDPLSDVTRKVRTQLLFVATFAILVKVYDLKVNKTPWLDIEVPETAPQLLDGILSVAVAYLLFTFLIYALQDFRRWRLSGELHLVQGSFDLLLNSRQDLNAIAQHIDKLTSNGPIDDAVIKAVAAAAERIPQSQAKLVTLGRKLANLSRLQWFRLIVIEIAAPTILGIIAVLKTWQAIFPFVRSVFV
jgi:hypothetical protein